MKYYVFDTSALFTYIENEDGANIIEDLLIKAIDKEIEIIVSVISLIEIFYISSQEQGEIIANERIEMLLQMPFAIFDLNLSLVLLIGNLKAKYKISFADSCIAGLTQLKNATLVHKDPEFEYIGVFEQLKLPYKLK